MHVEGAGRPAPSPIPSPASTWSRPGIAGRIRWWIVWTLFLFHGDQLRQPPDPLRAGPHLAATYHFSHTDRARILGAFQISYEMTWLLGGIFLDAVETLVGLGPGSGFLVSGEYSHWVLQTRSSALRPFVSVGRGEGFNWPGASKTVAEWVPSQERSIAVAISNSTPGYAPPK